MATDLKATLKDIDDKLFKEYETKLQAEREKYKGPLEKKISKLREDRKKIDDELKDLDKQLANITGRSPKKSSGGGGGTRLKKDQIADYLKRIGEQVDKAGKTGVKAGDVAEEFGDLDKQQIGNFLKKLVKAKTIRSEGKKAGTRYYAV